MTKKEKMMSLRNDTAVHYNCAQATLIPFAQEMGITEAQANALALNFGGGMGCGGACGALTGAMMVMGALGLPQEKRLELLRIFREANDEINCAPLLKAAADRGEERKTHCDKMISQCIDFLCQETGLE